MVSISVVVCSSVLVLVVPTVFISRDSRSVRTCEQVEHGDQVEAFSLHLQAVWEVVFDDIRASEVFRYETCTETSYYLVCTMR